MSCFVSCCSCGLDALIVNRNYTLITKGIEAAKKLLRSVVM